MTASSRERHDLLTLPRVTSTLFPITLDEERLEAEEDHATPSLDAKPLLRRIAEATAPTSGGEVQLLAALSSAKAAVLARAGGAKPDVWAVASELRCRHGLPVKIRHALVGKRKNYLRALRHTFIILPGGVAGSEGTDILLDLGFRDQFVLPWSDPGYEALLASLPADWVGPMDRLVAVVTAASAVLRAAFRAHGKPLPPWREPRALLSKWHPESKQDQEVPLVAVPPSERAPGAAGAGLFTAVGGGVLRAAGVAPPPPSAMRACGLFGGGAASMPGSLALPRAPSLEMPQRSKSDTSKPWPDVPRKIIVGFPAMRPSPHAELTRAAEAAPPAAGQQPQSAGGAAVPAVAQAAQAAAAASAAAAHASAAAAATRAAATTTAAAAQSTTAASQPGSTPYWSTADAMRPGHIAALAAGLQRAAAAAAAAAAVHEGPGAVNGLRVPLVDAAAAPRGLFKTLDQLLPPVRVVKLGVA